MDLNVLVAFACEDKAFADAGFLIDARNFDTSSRCERPYRA